MAIRTSLLLLFLILLPADAAFAQLEGRIAERPIGVGYTRNITQVTAFEYMSSLAKRLQIGRTLIDSAPQEQLDALRSEVEAPVNGVSWFMVQGLIPSFETVYFQEVLDSADARRFMNARKKVMGDQGEVKSEGENRYRFIMNNSWSYPVNSEEEGQKQVDQINSLNQNGNRSYQNSARLIDKDGKPHIEQSFLIQEFYRYQDNLLFSTSFEELWDMDLPARDSLTSSVSSDNDIGVEAFFDRIPVAIKTLGWNMLSASVGTQMQTRDDEAKVDADLRKSSLEFGLGVVRAAMFDIQEANGWVRFANEQEQSVRAELNLKTRRNSGLTKQLNDVSSGSSRFAPLLNDDAVFTAHSCFQISEDSAALPRAAAEWMLQNTKAVSSADDALVQSVAHLADTVSALGDSRTAEAFVKLGWTPESDGVIYGGIQVDDNPLLLRSLYNLATNIPDTPPGVKDAFAFSERDGVEQLCVSLPASVTLDLQQITSLALTHVYIVHQNSCLWLAVGNENAIEMIQQCIARCEDSGLVTRTPLLSVSVDVDRWLSLPEEDAVGVGGLLLWLDENEPTFPPSPVSFSFQQGGDESPKPTPLLKRCLDLGGDTTSSLTVLSDSGGVRLSIELGEAVANYYLARMIDSQDRMMSPRQLETEEATLEQPVPVDSPK